MPADASTKKHAAAVCRALHKAFPDATCALQHRNAYELLAATILSAQCTDERVNQVTPALFARCPSPRELADISQAELESLIQSTGFFRNKAKNLRACAARLAADFGNDVPQDLAALVQLPGVGRKTANVVLGTAYGLATGVVVDTHVMRLSQRMGLTEETDPEKIERDLMQLLPKREWIGFSHRMILHGRRVCKARKPLCDDCALRHLCPRVGVEE